MTQPFGTFFVPGPTEIRPEIMAAMNRPMIPHRGRDFETLFATIEAGLREVFLTSRPVYVSTSSATGLMEGAIRNAPEGGVVSLVNGAFSERFAKIARACGREVEIVQVPQGFAFDLNAVEEKIREARPAVVSVVHSETSTGVLTDVRAVTEIARRHGATCVVDSVSGVAGAELQFDEWGLDFVLTGSQKAFALPPGLAFAVASPEYLARAKKVKGRGIYFDVVELEAFALKHQTPNTPAISLLYALEAQLANIAREGIERRWERHLAMRAAVERWTEELSTLTGARIGILAPEGSRSPTVSAITLPTGVRGEELVRAVATRGLVIGSGYGSLKETTVRIGHMGDHTVETVGRCLAVVSDAVKALL